MQTLPPNVQSRRLYASIFVALVAVVVCGCSLLLAATASATDYTWQGGGSSTAWSNGGNWLGGTAPVASEVIGTLSLPLLPASQEADNNLSGLSVNHLQVDDSHGYVLSGQGLTLGSGGLSIGASEGSAGSFITATPMTLSGSQTWSVSQHVILGEALSGETSELTMNVNGATQFYFGDPYAGSPFGPLSVNNELGNVTINGSAPGAGGSLGSVVYLTGGKFNADDGHMLNLHNVQLEDGAVTGPITATSSSLFLGGGSATGPVALTNSQLSFDETLSLPSLSLDEHSTLKMHVGISGSNQSEEIVSTGAISLGDSALAVTPIDDPGSACLAPTVGQTYTLLSTTGSLSGTFGSYSVSGNPTNNPLLIPCFDGNHKTGPEEETAARVYLYRINYNTTGSPKTVTATVQPSVPVIFGENDELPTILGSATTGQTLSESHASWFNEPTSYSDQWQRCDSGGNNCQAIVGATGPSYTLTSADVGSTLRVQETATNSEGTSSPEVSAQTAVVQAGPAGSTNAGGSTTSGGSSSGAGSNGSISGGGTRATISSAQIAALLGKQLVPTGKATAILGLLKNGGLTMSFQALEAGTLTVQWYAVPSGAKLAKRNKAKPVLIASGQTSFAEPGTSKVKVRLTADGKKLLKHAKTVKVEVKGVFRSSGGVAINSIVKFSLP